MRPAWIGFIFFLALIMALLVSIPLDEFVPAKGEFTGPMQTLLSYTQVLSNEDWFTLVNPMTHINFFTDLMDVLVWGETSNVLFPPGSPYILVKWLIWGPIIATVVFGLVLLFIGILRRAV